MGRAERDNTEQVEHAGQPIQLKWIVAAGLVILVIAAIVLWSISHSQAPTTDDETFEGYMTFETPEI